MNFSLGAIATPGSPSGYGTISREIGRYLPKGGAAYTPGPDWDVLVMISTPINWPLGRGLRPDVCWHTMFDMQSLPPGWTDVLNRCGSVWLPSQWSVELFRTAGVTVPLFVVGYGIDHDRLWPVERVERSAPFKVLAWGSSLTGRKNILQAVRVFMRANLPDAVLEIKVNAGQSAPFVKWDNVIQPNIVVHAEDWLREDLAGWLRGGDVLLYLSGGEGFGLMPLEAMATGLPVICHACTGMLDYLTPDNALCVPSKGLVECAAYSVRYGVPLQMLAPDLDAAVAHLRWAYHNRPALYTIGRRGQLDATAWTWDRMGQAAVPHLERYHATAG